MFSFVGGCFSYYYYFYYYYYYYYYSLQIQQQPGLYSFSGILDILRRSPRKSLQGKEATV